MEISKVLIFGGNGFVGTAIAKLLVEQNITPICVSRTGSKPLHLIDVAWADKVEWVQGDANSPQLELFDGIEVIMTLIGSPPVPTFSQSAYQQQLHNNSAPNLAVIESAKAAGVKRVVVMGAHLPKLMSTDCFAYAKGKRLSLEAAKEFSERSDQYSSIVLQPTGIYGVRYTKVGKPINLGLVLKPMAKLQHWVPEKLKQWMPETLVSDRAVARAAIDACLNERFEGKFTVIPNQQILEFEN